MNAQEVARLAQGPRANQPDIVQAGDRVAMIIAFIPLLLVAGSVFLRVIL